MASISSLSGSGSASSIYGNRTYNIISGLASGLDTESLITGAIQGYQQKIQSLQSKNTKLQWQQEAYQSISDKLVEFYRNYSSYVYSENNLASSGFFNNAVTTTTNGTYAKFISASGKTSSTVAINAVRQLATAARYTVSGSHLSGVTDGTVTADKRISDLTKEIDLSTLSGSLTLNYGDRTVSIDFGERELFTKEDGSFDAAGFEAAIEEKLSEQKISTSSGSVVNADTLIDVSVNDQGVVSFTDKSSAGNSVSIASVSGNLETMILNKDDTVDGKSHALRLDLNKDLVEKKPTAEYLAGKTITVTLDGKSKTIELPKIEVVADGQDGSKTAQKFIDELNKELKTAFGTTTAADGSVQNRVSVDLKNVDLKNVDLKNGALSFTNTDQGSTLAVKADTEDVGDVLGIGTGLTTYVDATKTLEDLKGIDWSKLAGYEAKGVGGITQQKDEDGNVIPDKYVDAAGNAVDKDGYLVDEDGKRVVKYDLVINDVKIGSYSKDTELNTIINNINSNTEAGVNVSYSKTTGQFVFTAKDTGAGGRIQIKDTKDSNGLSTNLGSDLFGAVMPSADPGGTASTTMPGASYTAGVDAKISATVNGETMELTRSSNTFDLDGMSVTVSGTFHEELTEEEIKKLPSDETVTFTSKTDSDKVVEVVKKMVEDLNAIIKEVKSAYSDMPLQKSDGSNYEPLTDEDMEGMSESEIERYEEKAKTGILFMDSDLSALYNDLRNAITSSGSDGVTLRSMGIETAYSDGLTTITFDEKKFREALESDPDKVQEAFTKSKENGAATDGLMATITAITDKYADTDGDVKGLLIEKAGSKYSPTAALDNDILDQMKEVEEQIAKWQDKMSNQVDYYTNRFTQLEMLINQMNSQSSALAGLMGG